MSVDVAGILGKYNLNIYGVTRAKGGFLANTDQGPKLLLEHTKADKRLELGDAIRNELVNCGYTVIDTYMRNTQGELIHKEPDEKKYVVKNWFQGRECDIYSDEEVLVAVKELARLHMCLVRVEERLGEEHAEMLLQKGQEHCLEKHYKEIKRAVTYVRGKKLKNDFELILANNAGGFLKDAGEAIDFLKENSVGDWESRLLHGDYNHHNIIWDEGFVAITDLEWGYRGAQILDLCNFMRKVLEKRGYAGSIGIEMYKMYVSVKGITEGEKQLLYAFLLFPEKFWKVVNSYYNHKKNLLPKKNMEKLEMCIEQQRFRREFTISLLQQ